MNPPVTTRTHRLAAIAAALLLLVAMTWLSRDFGFTWDERFQQKYGEEVWDYLHGRLPRASFDTDFGNQYLYSALVEVIGVAAQHTLHGDTYVIRHVVSAVFGWGGIVVCGLLAGRAFGRTAGWTAAALLTLSPRYFADSMNNSKDAPFAAVTMVVLYITLSVDWRRPGLSWTRAAALLAAVAAAINIRPLGLALLAYSGGVLGLATLVAALGTTETDRWRRFAMTVIRLACIAVIVVPLGTLTWPYAQGQPFVRPLTAFVQTTKLDWAAGYGVLFAGQDLDASVLPWNYVPVWLAMALPPVVLIGCAVSWLSVRRGVREACTWAGLALFAAAPVVTAMFRHPTLYDGIRHLLFVFPPLAVLAAAGWQALIETRARALAIVLLAIGLLEPLVFDIRNHPNEIVYFTPLMGGPRAAFARYDMDYWGNSVLEAVKWTDSVARASGIPVIVSGNPIQAVDADAARFRTLMVAPRATPTYHFDIRLLRGPHDAVREFASRPDILHAVTTADGTPLCVVIPGPAYLAVSDRLKFPDRAAAR